jgi:hypothetical protein
MDTPFRLFSACAAIVSARRKGLTLALALVLSGLFSASLFAQVQAQDAAGTAIVEASSVAEYQAALAAAQTALEGSQDDDSALAAARAILAKIRKVQLDNGDVVEITPLLGEDGDELTRVHAQARVDLTARQLAGAGNDNTAARMAALARVLEGAEFNQGETLLDQVQRWLRELWSKWFPEQAPDPAATSTAQSAETIVGWVVIAFVVVAVIWILSYWLRGLLGNFVADANAKRQGGADEDLPQTPAAARERAGAQARAGNYREAVRSLYLSALLTLEEKGMIVPDRSLTNREVLARLEPGHPLRPHFEPVVETFDSVWYGVHEPDNATYESYTHSIDELEGVAQRAEKTAAKKA